MRRVGVVFLSIADLAVCQTLFIIFITFFDIILAVVVAPILTDAIGYAGSLCGAYFSFFHQWVLPLEGVT